jgi:hypothetical protein
MSQLLLLTQSNNTNICPQLTPRILPPSQPKEHLIREKVGLDIQTNPQVDVTQALRPLIVFVRDFNIMIMT